MSEKIQFTPTFIKTKNVRTFETMMEGLLLARGKRGEGDERLGCVSGRAGRGKTRTVQTWAARNGCAYVETVAIWSELDFLKNLAKDLRLSMDIPEGMIPGRRGVCFDLVVDLMLASGRPVFIDEIERFGQRFIEIVRDLAKITGGVIVMIGEEELPHLLNQNRRSMSRTYRQMVFEPVSPSDIITYVGQCTGLQLTEESTTIMHKASGGDLRIVKRDTINLAHVAARLLRSGPVDGELARIACKQGLQG